MPSRPTTRESCRASDNCADNLYGDGSFDSTWGDACLDDDGNVQAASETCYQTLASNDEAALADKKSDIGQCARGAAAAAGATTPLAMTLALVGAMVLASLA